MKTDRELLELAAKAAGIDAHWGNSWQSDRLFRHLPRPRSPLVTDVEWNPLTDDGDEARLESVLEMDVAWLPDEVVVDDCRERYEHHGGDRQAARRWAGVRAAAAIGEQA